MNEGQGQIELKVAFMFQQLEQGHPVPTRGWTLAPERGHGQDWASPPHPASMSSPDIARPAPDPTPKLNQSDANGPPLDTPGDALVRSPKGPAGDTAAATKNTLESTSTESAAIMEPPPTSTPPRTATSPKDQNENGSTPVATAAPLIVSTLQRRA
ncbi:unnamed protein product [Mortierella alpina]